MDKKKRRKYRYDKKLKLKILLDPYNEPYYSLDEQDKVQAFSLALPKSLIKLVDRKRGDNISRSRFIRKAIENELNVERNY
jgi:hypothetical protein